ncbi:hypothetical protein TI04_13180, partial [Achromatium sp. WMS2]
MTPMRRAVAFCQVIEPSTGKNHKVSSKYIADMFAEVVAAYNAAEGVAGSLQCAAQHVDGTM